MLSRNFYIKDILKMALPIVLGNLGFILIGIGDVIVAGRHSTETLSAISIATAITNCIMIFGIGILGSVSAILSNYRGKGKSIDKYFFPTIKFSIYLSLIVSALIFAFIPIISKLGFGSDLETIIKDYFFVTGFASLGGYLHFSLKEYLQAFEIVFFPNILTIFCIFLNVILNVLFVFGLWVFPELGAVGLALASLIVRYFMGFVLLIYCIRKGLVGNISDKNYHKDLLKVGVPASLAIMIEFVGFNIISVIMGRVSGIYAAAHNIICTLTSVAFMIPLAISNAIAVKVGYANGAGYYRSLKGYAYSGIKFSVIFMAISAVLLGLMPKYFVSIFTKDIELIKICVPIVYLLCLFQIFDGLQVTLSGIFKGLKHTKIVMIANFIGYWIIAFPFGSVLAFRYRLNLLGYWVALGISSAILCMILYISMLKKFRNYQA